MPSSPPATRSTLGASSAASPAADAAARLRTLPTRATLTDTPKSHPPSSPGSSTRRRLPPPRSLETTAKVATWVNPPVPVPLTSARSELHGQSPKKRSVSQRVAEADVGELDAHDPRGLSGRGDTCQPQPPAHKRQRVGGAAAAQDGQPSSSSTTTTATMATATVPRQPLSYSTEKAHRRPADTGTVNGSGSASSCVSSSSSSASSTSSSDSAAMATARAAARVVANVLACAPPATATPLPHLPPSTAAHDQAPAPTPATPPLPVFNPSHPPRSDWCPVVHVSLPFSTAVLTSSRTLTSAARALAASNADRHRSQSPGSPFAVASPHVPPLPPSNRLVTSTPPPTVPCLPLRIAGYSGQAHDISGQGTPTSLMQVNQFTLHALMPRSICAALHAAGISPALQFDIIGSVPPGERPRPRVPSQLPLVEEMKHMRKSLLVTIPPASDPDLPPGQPAPHAAAAHVDVWELHLKVNATGHQLDGYLIPRSRAAAGAGSRRHHCACRDGRRWRTCTARRRPA
ncbi:hypothetical protein BCR44DRAFT_1457488 [Catenaria anguillulae PL171]|uniref:Uncharacterized protein n=1 Tax=Catenaria anguillulae PL171 TaxID=765915 RepID=A0A1Y2I2R9_9FUNG|nr:hypothetical protein BCR44DRAFT_1457488 [Catenaria anguillulae PL171]